MYFVIDEIPEEGLTFEIEKNNESFEIDQPECSLSRGVRVTGSLNKVGNEIYFSGRIKTELSLTCSRCLEPFCLFIDSKASAHFKPLVRQGKEHSEIELHPSDIDVEVYEGNQIDLTQAVHDQIILSIPLSCLCDQKCKGLCPRCGFNLNKGSCGCDDEPITDPRLEALKSLKKKLK